jgi:gluconolactonase
MFRRMMTASFVLACTSILAAQDNKPIAGLGPVGPIEKKFTGFAFTEGPAVDAVGNVYFTDIPKTSIHKIDLQGKLSLFTDKSNSSNGLMVNPKGEIVACEMEGQVVARTPDGQSRRILAEKYEGVRFNAPNDLVLDKAGGLYFTDPEFKAPKPWPQGKTCVYYLDAQGKVTRLIDNLKNPNGVILSPDEKTLYIIPSGSKEMMSYPVDAPGKIGMGKVFCTLQQPMGKDNTGGDGLTVDIKGNLYITSALGLQVHDPAGKLLGIIAFPEQPANVAFGGADMKTLFVTARTSLYICPMEIAGHRFPGK